MKELGTMRRKAEVDLLSRIRETHWNIEIGNFSVSDCRNCIRHVCHLIGVVTCQNQTEMFFVLFCFLFILWPCYKGYISSETLAKKLKKKPNAAFTGADIGKVHKAK